MKSKCVFKNEIVSVKNPNKNNLNKVDINIYDPPEDSIVLSKLVDDTKLVVVNSPLHVSKMAEPEVCIMKYIDKKLYNGILIITPRLEKFDKRRQKYRSRFNKNFFHEYDENIKYNEKFLIINIESMMKLKKLNYDYVIFDRGFYFFEKMARDNKEKYNDENIVNFYNEKLPLLLNKTKKIIHIDFNITQFHFNYLKKYDINLSPEMLERTDINHKSITTGALIQFTSIDLMNNSLDKKLRKNRRICIFGNDFDNIELLYNNYHEKHNTFFLKKDNIDNFINPSNSVGTFLKKNKQIKLFFCDYTLCLNMDFDKHLFSSAFILCKHENLNVRDIVLSCFNFKNYTKKKIYIHFVKDAIPPRYKELNDCFRQNLQKISGINPNHNLIDIFHNEYLPFLYESHGETLLLHEFEKFRYFLDVKSESGSLRNPSMSILR